MGKSVHCLKIATRELHLRWEFDHWHITLGLIRVRLSHPIIVSITPVFKINKAENESSIKQIKWGSSEANCMRISLLSSKLHHKNQPCNPPLSDVATLKGSQPIEHRKLDFFFFYNFLWNGKFSALLGLQLSLFPAHESREAELLHPLQHVDSTPAHHRLLWVFVHWKDK